MVEIAANVPVFQINIVKEQLLSSNKYFQVKSC